MLTTSCASLLCTRRNAFACCGGTKRTTPLGRRGARSHRNDGWLELLERLCELGRRELAVVENFPVLIERANLVTTLCQIDRDEFNLAHGGLLLLWVP